MTLTTLTADWHKLGGLMFVARRLVEGLLTGQHAALGLGPGVDFHDYRAYTPGDPLSDVDWKLYGRTDRFYLRRYRHLSELHAYLMLDCSASMHFSGLDRRGRPLPAKQVSTKLSYGAALAAAIGFLTIRQADRAGVGLFSDRIIEHLPPGGTWAHLKRLCNVLENARPRQGQGRLKASLRQAHALMKRRGLLVIISDLLEDPDELLDGLSRFRHDRFEVIVFQTLSPQELDLSGLGRLSLEMVDSETHQRLRTDVDRTAKAYAERMQQHISQIRRGCLGQGIDFNLLCTDQPVTGALRRYLVKRSAALGG